MHLRKDNGYIWNIRMFIIIHINFIPKVVDPPQYQQIKGGTWYKIQ